MRSILGTRHPTRPAEEAGATSTTGWLNKSLPSASPLFLYDVVEKWRALTSLPAVLAVWAARPAAATSKVVRDFQDALSFGIQQIPEISTEAAGELNLPVERIHRYLTENIDYTLDEENLRGLQRYYDLSAELGLIREAKPFQIVSFEQTPELASTRRT